MALCRLRKAAGMMIHFSNSIVIDGPTCYERGTGRKWNPRDYTRMAWSEDIEDVTCPDCASILAEL